MTKLFFRIILEIKMWSRSQSSLRDTYANKPLGLRVAITDAIPLEATGLLGISATSKRIRRRRTQVEVSP
jgi:hypothetical protein